MTGTTRTHQPWCTAHEYTPDDASSWGFCVRPLRDTDDYHVEILDGGRSDGPEVEVVCWDGESLTVDKARTLAQSILVACELLESEARR